ncbi:MAG: hypothetical protein COA37_15540 [Hoeflea sp.]|uniref:hypothetical protein n=1 Tax=Hoeflea sp. TaxID=1940281 RepID=UPI000C121EE3|nr:hypothetical protein [Hoeflea sp.]PHR19923.1 MAG: hypothetical protein COA37_15540 [Hoeflea sp.]
METYLMIAGSLLLVIGVATVYFKRDISAGQSMVFVFGVGLIALPHILNFEWSNGTFKFTTKSESAQLTVNVKSVAEQQADLAGKVVSLTDAVGKITEQIQTLESELRTSNPSQLGAVPAFKPSDWKTLQLDSQALVGQTNMTIQSLDALQNQLQGISGPVVSPNM